MIVLPGAEPYAADRGPVGVVLSHGFTATTRSMRPWAESLAAAGYTVRLPRLPGHGTTWQEGNRLAGLILVNPSFATERFDARFARYVCRVIPSRPGLGSDIKAPHEDTLGYDRTP